MKYSNRSLCIELCIVYQLYYTPDRQIYWHTPAVSNDSEVGGQGHARLKPRRGKQCTRTTNVTTNQGMRDSNSSAHRTRRHPVITKACQPSLFSTLCVRAESGCWCKAAEGAGLSQRIFQVYECRMFSCLLPPHHLYLIFSCSSRTDYHPLFISSWLPYSQLSDSSIVTMSREEAGGGGAAQ